MPVTKDPPVKPATKKERERLSAEELDKRSAEVAAKAAKEQKELEDKTLKFVEDNYADMDATTRNDILDRVVRAVRSVKTVATASKLRLARSHVIAEERASMPRLTPPARVGEAPSRNIMSQSDQNKSEALGGKK
jgi:hypothetical protein